MMNCPMMMREEGSWLMIGMRLVWLLIIAVLLLAIAALIKYPRAARPRI